MATPSLLLIPDRYKASKLYSQIPDTGAGDLAFTRALDTATRVNSEGLIEKVRTNLNTYSQDFTATGGWAALFGATITRTANYGIAPDGTTTSTRIVFGGGSQIYSKTISGLTGNIGVFSLWIKGTAGETIAITYGGASDKLVTLGSGWTRFSTNGNSASNNTIYINTFLSATALDIEVWGGQVEFGDIATDYIPTTTAAVSVGPVADIPRIDYTGGGCGKLLLEPQRTNLATNSEIWNGTGWIAESASVTVNSVISPSGYQDADTLTGTGSFSRLRQSGFALADNTDYTISSFLKAGTAYSVLLTFINKAGTDTFYRFNLQDGTAQSGAKIEDYGNGWYRCSFTANSGSGATTTSVRFASNDAGTTGGWTTGLTIHAWGAQFEAGSYATSYIPTLGASVTRSADAASKTGISSLIGQTEGTIFVEFNSSNVVGVDNTVFGLSTGSALSRIIIFFGVNVSAQVRNAGVVQGTITGPSSTANTTFKCALAYNLNDVAFYVNGVLIGTDTSAIIPATSDVRFDGGGGANTCDVPISQALVFKTRLSTSELASLTSL